MTFKQKYIHEKGPFPFNFEQERKQMFEKIINLLQQFDRNMWTVSSFNFGAMIESFKQVYGLTSIQLETLMTLLANIFYEQPESSVEPRLIILKLLNRLLQEQIQVTQNFKISNEKLMSLIIDRVKNGTKDSLKHQDSYMEQLSKFILSYSKYGEEYVQQSMQKAIQYKNTRILALFIASLKTQTKGEEVVNQLLKDCSLWERDVSWFYVISEIAKKYPKLDFSSHYVTIFQEIIKIFTTMLDPASNDDLKKLTDSQPCIGIRSIMKSMACLLVNLLLPNSYSQSSYVWNAVERIFNIITTTLDHINQPAFIYEQLQFMRAFVKYFLLRYRKQRNIYLQKNEDFLQDFHGQPEGQLFVDDWLHKNFNGLWPQIIPKILFYQQNDSMSSKIIVDLAMFDHQYYMPIILSSLKSLLLRDDLNMISLYSTKMSILFLFDYVFKDQKGYIPQFLGLFTILLQDLQKLGISQNLDILQLVFRSFIYMDQDTLNNQPLVEQIIQDGMQIVFKNLESMSISLQNNDSDQSSQLYIDLANIYFPFFVRLQKKTLDKFMDKLTYKILNQIPQHTEAYQLLSIICSYIEPTFAQKLFKEIYSKMISVEQQPSISTLQHQGQKLRIKRSAHNGQQTANTKQHNKLHGNKQHTGKQHHNVHHKSQKLQPKKKPQQSYYFFQNIKQTLSTKNQNHIKWYCELIQCLYQYHPQILIRDWNKLETVIICLLKEWDNTTFMEIALDILFNLVLCLCHVHFNWKEFSKPQNNDYSTLNISWNTGTPQSTQLLLHIYNKYYIQLIDFMKNRYGHKVEGMEDNTIITQIFNGVQYPIQSSHLKLIDSLLLPQPNQNTEHMQQKKLIYKIFSIQYTIHSALMNRSSFYPGAHQCNNSFLDIEEFKNIRKMSNQYCAWIQKLMQYYNILWQPNNIKLYNFYWRQSLDQVFFSAPLGTTVQKITPYYYSQIYRKKQLLRCSFLILNQTYMIYTYRMQFLLEVNPVAYLNNPQYLKKHLILGLNHQFQSGIHSYLPSSYNVHQAHRNLMLLCRYHIDSTNKNSYSYKYLNSTQKRQKQKYLVALKMILANIKKNQNPINYECCIKDDFILDSLIDCIQLFKTFQNKIDKMIVIDLFYLMIVFGFDCNLVGENRQTDLKKYFEYSVESNQALKQTYTQQFLCSMKQMINIQFAQSEKMDEETLIQSVNLKLKRTSSFRSPGHISVRVTQKIQSFIEHALKRLNVQKSLLDKDSIIYCLMMIMFSKFLLLSNPLFGKITTTLIELTKSDIVQLFDVSKTGLFHIINRFNSLKKISTQIPNSIVKRSFDDFLVLRYLGGQPKNSKDLQYYKQIYMDKNDNYFYPVQKLLFFQYQSLGDDPDSDALDNQKEMLKFLTNHNQLKRFILACSHDKDLKDQDPEAVDVSMLDQNSIGIASNGHKLLNYVLDSNPKKNDIFAPFIENFSIYPVSFYPRMLRKVIRMGNQNTITNLIQIAEQLRQSEQIEQKKMSLYISCQIMFVTPIQNTFTKNFIDYLATCSNDVFDFSAQIIFLMFTKNFVTAREIYNALITRFREQKGTSRLRHLTIMNLFLMAQGRFSRQVAIDGIKHLLKGVQQGSNEVSDVIITMIVSCFVIAINLKQINPWIQESISQLIRDKKVYKLNEFVGYQIDEALKSILQDIVQKTKVQKNMQSKNLKIYSKIANKILSSISVYRYNDSFYEVLKNLIFYVVQKIPEEGQTDQQIILQLKDSQYPENIYLDLVNNLINMVDNPQSVIKKKLMFLESLVINYCYSMNKLSLPQEILKINQKVMSMDFIVSVSNMYRLMTRSQTIQRVEKQMSKTKDKNIYNLMALLLSTGVRQYEWKVEVLKEILKSKKLKIVKEFISEWWKGKNPQSQTEKTLQYLVQGVQNPYSYFA